MQFIIIFAKNKYTYPYTFSTNIWNKNCFSGEAQTKQRKGMKYETAIYDYKIHLIFHFQHLFSQKVGVQQSSSWQDSNESLPLNPVSKCPNIIRS